MKNNEILIDNNFLTKDQQKEYYQQATSFYFPWYFNENTIYEEDSSSVGFKQFDDGYQFTHNIFKNGEVSSTFFPLFFNIFETFCEKNNVEAKTLLRAKLNFNASNDSPQTRPAHVDYDMPHNVFIYYFNDSDGDTIIYNEKHNQGNKDLSIYKKISPEMGRGVMFNGLHYHSPQTPSKNPFRIILNVAFI